MNCFECTRIRENRHICNDVLSLFNKLNIPHQEQIILWRMTNKETDCASLKNILYVVSARKVR
jgi:hypothetical protein